MGGAAASHNMRNKQACSVFNYLIQFDSVLICISLNHSKYEITQVTILLHGWKFSVCRLNSVNPAVIFSIISIWNFDTSVNFSLCNICHFHPCYCELELVGIQMNRFEMKLSCSLFASSWALHQYILGLVIDMRLSNWL